MHTKPRSDNLGITESSSQLLWTASHRARFGDVPDGANSGECFHDYDEHFGGTCDHKLVNFGVTCDHI